MSFHADPVFPISGMDHGFRKSGNLKDLPELLFCWIEQFISRNIFLLLFNPTEEEFREIFQIAGFAETVIHTRDGENWICVEGHK